MPSQITPDTQERAVTGQKDKRNDALGSNKTKPLHCGINLSHVLWSTHQLTVFVRSVTAH